MSTRREALRDARREADAIPDDRRGAHEARFDAARAAAERHRTYIRL